MSVGAIVTIERSIMSVLAQAGHSGARSTGAAIVRATGADVLLPHASYATPSITSAAGSVSADRHLMVKVNAPTVPTGQANRGIVVTAAGVSVPLFSMMGGLDKNLPAGTPLRWSWPIDGVELVSVVDPSGMTGGLNPPATSFGLVKRMVSFEAIGGDAAAALFSAGVGDFPAMVIGWQGSQPWEKTGQGRAVTDHNFRLYVVTSRMSGWSDRADEGKEILEDVAEILSDRAEADGVVFASPPVTLGPQGRLALAATSLVYYQDISVRFAVKTRELRTFQKLATVRETLLSDTTANVPPTLTRVDQKQTIP